MFGFGARLPIDEDAQAWVDEGFMRLSRMLGRERMLRATLVLPDDRYFPDSFDGSRASVTAMAKRIASYMGVAPDAFTVEIYAETENAWLEGLPVALKSARDAAGLYYGAADDGRFLIGLHGNQLKEPIALASTIAHELAHVVLLGGGLLDGAVPDMEPMTDLCTVFLGMGFFTASSAFQFKQWTSDRTQGWSTKSKGYLPEGVWGYALARFAHERGESEPAWAKQLTGNIKAYFLQSAKWLKKEGTTDRMK